MKLFLFKYNFYFMKFRLINVDPIKDAEIELGDFTLFLGLPSNGKSFAIRSIYTSLIFLDKEYEHSLRNKLYIFYSVELKLE